MTIIYNDNQDSRHHEITEKMTQELLAAAMRMFFNKDYAGLHVLAQSLDDVATEIAKELDEPARELHVSMAKKIISDVYQLMNKDSISNDSGIYPVYAEDGEQIKKAFDDHCRKFDKFSGGISPWIEDVLHQTHFSIDSSLQTKMVSLIAGCIAHEIAPGFLNIDTPENLKTLTNPFANGMWAISDKAVLGGVASTHFERFKYNAYKEHSPENIGVESAMAYFNKNLEGFSLHIEDNYANYAENLSIAIADAPDPHTHWSDEFKNLLKQIDSAMSLHELLLVMNSADTAPHLEFKFQPRTKNGLPDVGHVLNAAAEAGVFGRRLLGKIDTLCESLLPMDLTHKERIQATKTIEEITVRFTQTIQHTCGDMLLPSLVQIVPPPAILWVPMPLTSLESYIRTVGLDQMNALLCLVALSSNLTSTPSCKCFYTSSHLAKNLFTSSLSMLGFKQVGILQDSTAKTLMSNLDKLLGSVSSDVDNQLARLCAEASVLHVDSISAADHPQNMDFLGFKPI